MSRDAGASGEPLASEAGQRPLSERVRSSREGDVVMAAARFARFDGAYQPLPYLGLYLCVAGGGPLVRRSEAQQLDGRFLPGRVGLGAPNAGGTGCWPRMDLLALGIAPARLAALVEELPGARLDLEAAASTFHDDALLSAAIAAMWRECELHGLSTAFFDHALAVAAHRLVPARRGRPAASNHALGRQQMDRVTDFIEAHLGTDITVARMAALVDLSPNHFSRCFRAATGAAPYAFLTRRRMERAAGLLAATDLPVTEIAALNGYANPSQFASAFRRLMGMPPSAYRRAR